MKPFAQQLQKQYSESNRDQGANVLSLSDAIVGDVRTILLVLLAAAGLLLLIGLHQRVEFVVGPLRQPQA